MNNYFEDIIANSDAQINVSITNSGIIKDNNSVQIEEATEELSEIEYDTVIEGVINKSKIESLYQPIIDVEAGKVVAYEVLSKIRFGKKVDIEAFLKYAEEKEQYNKIQQMLFINGLEQFGQISMKESNKL